MVPRDADVRRYVRECLGDRADLRVLEAATIGMATRPAALQPPKLLIVDAPDAGVVDAFMDVHAALIADDVPRETMPNARVIALPRPFGAQDLQAIVDRLTL